MFTDKDLERLDRVIKFVLDNPRNMVSVEFVEGEAVYVVDDVYLFEYFDKED